MKFLYFGLVFLASYGLGSLTLRPFRLQWSSFWQHAVMAMGCGLVVLSYVVFFSGAAGLLSRTIAVVFLSVLSAAGLLVAARRWKNIPSMPEARGRLGAFDYLLVAVLLVCVALNGLVALAPPTAADAINYHFAYPKLYVDRGRVDFILGSYQANIMGLHMLYLLGMLLSGAKEAALVSWGAGVLLAGAVVLAGQRWFGSVRVGLLAAALLYTAPLVTQVAVTGQLEVGLTLFSFLALLAFLEWTREPSSLRWLVPSGIFAGFAAGTKYYGLFAVLVLTVLLVAVLLRDRLFGLLWKALLVFIVVSAVVGSPFYIRNAIYTGNPVYPTFYSIFGGRYWSEAMDASFRVFVRQHKRPLGRNVAAFFLGPWTLTMKDGLQGYGPAFLSLLPLLPLGLWSVKTRRAMQPALVLFAFSSLFYLLWLFVAAQRARHLLPAVAVLSLLLAIGTSQALRLGTVASLVAGGSFLLAVGTGVGFNGVYNAQFLPVVFGAEPERSFLERKLWYYKDVMWINQHLSSRDKVFPLIIPVHLYLDVNYVPTSIHIHGFLDWTRLRDEEELYRRLKDEGFTHVFFDSAVLSQAESRQSDRVQRLERHVALLFKKLVDRYGEVLYQDRRMVPFYRSLDWPRKSVRPVVVRLLEG
ncbi:MAG: ArnT family glycosyltransferase [Nitrospinota bacterium]